MDSPDSGESAVPPRMNGRAIKVEHTRSLRMTPPTNHVSQRDSFQSISIPPIVNSQPRDQSESEWESPNAVRVLKDGVAYPAPQPSLARASMPTHITNDVQIPPPLFDSLLETLRENRIAQLAGAEQQRELIRYMKGLDEWLERDVRDRQTEIRGVVARVDQLSHDLHGGQTLGITRSSSSRGSSRNAVNTPSQPLPLPTQNAPAAQGPTIIAPPPSSPPSAAPRSEHGPPTPFVPARSPHPMFPFLPLMTTENQTTVPPLPAQQAAQLNPGSTTIMLGVNPNNGQAYPVATIVVQSPSAQPQQQQQSGYYQPYSQYQPPPTVVYPRANGPPVVPGMDGRFYPSQTQQPTEVVIMPERSRSSSPRIHRRWSPRLKRSQVRSRKPVIIPSARTPVTSVTDAPPHELGRKRTNFGILSRFKSSFSTKRPKTKSESAGKPKGAKNRFFGIYPLGAFSGVLRSSSSRSRRVGRSRSRTPPVIIPSAITYSSSRSPSQLPSRLPLPPEVRVIELHQPHEMRPRSPSTPPPHIVHYPSPSPPPVGRPLSPRRIPSPPSVIHIGDDRRNDSNVVVEEDPRQTQMAAELSELRSMLRKLTEEKENGSRQENMFTVSKNDVMMFLLATLVILFGWSLAKSR